MIAKKITNSSDQPDFQVLANRGRRTWVGSEAALEAALANDELTEGTVADTYTEGSITNGTQRRKVAWSLAQSVTATQLINGYTAPADGIFTCTSINSDANNNNAFICVNGLQISQSYSRTPAAQGNLARPGYCIVDVNQGDIITIEGTTSITVSTCNFVPFEDSTVQNVFVVTPEYIRQQNVLSDYESITLGSSYATAFECQYDGFITFTGNATAPNDIYIYVNNVSLSRVGVSSGSFELSRSILVKKGDKVHSNGTVSAFGTFYKLRDYGDRT